MITRKEYMAATFANQTTAHREYYSQFVTTDVLGLVSHAIGADRIRASTDPHFNDIPLRLWDALEPPLQRLCLSIMGDINGAIRTDARGTRTIAWSLGDAVCIAKQAARQIKGE